MLFKLLTETTIISFLIKMFTFKKGSGLILSTVIASIVTISTNQVFVAVLKNTDVKNLVLPVFVEVAGFTLYFLFNIADFGAGIWYTIANARKNNTKAVFDKDKLYKTLWKMLGVLLLTILVMFVAILSEIIGASYAWNFFVFALALVFTLACLWEFRSIGKNIERGSGSKPEIFYFMDKVLNAIQKRTLREIDEANILKGKSEEQNFEAPTDEIEQTEEK